MSPQSPEEDAYSSDCFLCEKSSDCNDEQMSAEEATLKSMLSSYQENEQSSDTICDAEGPKSDAGASSAKQRADGRGNGDSFEYSAAVQTALGIRRRKNRESAERSRKKRLTQMKNLHSRLQSLQQEEKELREVLLRSEAIVCVMLARIESLMLPQTCVDDAIPAV